MWFQPKLWPAILYALPAIFGVVLMESAKDGSVATLIGGGLALVGGLMCGVTITVYFGKWFMEFLDSLSKSLTRTRQSVTAESIRHLNSDQLAVVHATGQVSIGLLITARGPRWMVEGTGVPLSFVRDEFLPRCALHQDGRVYLASINSWSDGKTYQFNGENYGQCRTLAKSFTQHLIDNGLAVWGDGNRSAWLVGDLSVWELRRLMGLDEGHRSYVDLEQFEVEESAFETAENAELAEY